MGCQYKARLAAAKEKILTAFKCRDLGPADRYLNICIDRDRASKTLAISLPKHVEDILDK